jgi:hypothetical protein
MKNLFFVGALVMSSLLVGCLDESELEGIEDSSDSDSEETLSEVSSALASGCTHTSFVSKPGNVQGQGAVSCSNPQSRIRVDVELRRDNRIVARSLNDRCFNTRSCFTRAQFPDSPGSQRWCAPSLAGTPILDHRAPTHCVNF